MCGNITAHIAHTLADAPSAIDTVTLWAMAVFALINLSFFFVTFWLQRKTAGGTACGQTASVPSNELSFDSRVQAVASRYSLSQREHQILLEYAVGRSAPFIAKKHYLSVFTVKNYISRIYSKLNIHSRQQLLDKLEEEQRTKLGQL
jgi:DNA-binding CsgD family transcriptional regulator